MEDFGRGCPVDYNQLEKKYNWELVYCELYAGGKYNNNSGDNYEYSLAQYRMYTVQIADVERKNSAGQYLTFRFFTTFMAFAICTVYILYWANWENMLKIDIARE